MIFLKNVLKFVIFLKDTSFNFVGHLSMINM